MPFSWFSSFQSKKKKYNLFKQYFLFLFSYHFFSLLKACCLVFPEQGFTARGKVALQQIMPEDSLVPQPSVCGRDSRIHLVTQVLTVFCTALDTPRRKSVSHDDIMPIWRIWEKSPIISDRGHADAFQILQRCQSKQASKFQWVFSLPKCLFSSYESSHGQVGWHTTLIPAANRGRWITVVEARPVCIASSIEATSLHRISSSLSVLTNRICFVLFCSVLPSHHFPVCVWHTSPVCVCFSANSVFTCMIFFPSFRYEDPVHVIKCPVLSYIFRDIQNNIKMAYVWNVLHPRLWGMLDLNSFLFTD